MSTPFTNQAGTTWQTMLDEITLAYSERRQALGQSAYTPEDSRDVQSVAYWAELQNWLETSCVSFIDHVNGPLTSAGDEFLYFTLDNWRATAGLNATGFRRSVDGITMLYGQMQEGDAIGPWVFEDLQKGFGALELTVENGTWTDNGEMSVRSVVANCGGTSWEGAKREAEIAWDSTPNSLGGAGAPGAQTSGHIEIMIPEAGIYRAYAYPRVSLPASFTSRAIDLYLKGIAPHIWNTPGILDFNGDDVQEELTHIGSVEATSGNINAIFAKVGQTPQSETYPTWCEPPAWSSIRGYTACLFNLFHWNFTNA